MRISHRLLAGTVAILVGTTLAVSLVSLLRQKARSIARTSLSIVKAVGNGSRVGENNQGNYTNIVFLHHSVGRELIRQGRLRELLSQAGFCFYDHDYNNPGLTGPDGNLLGYSYNVPGNNTDPDGLFQIFQQKSYRHPLNTLSGLLQHEVIIIKSCFTSVRSLSVMDLERQKQEYLQISERMVHYPKKLFIIMTSPPANPAETDAGSASRARLLANWLCSKEFGGKVTNLRVFDLFSLLADDAPDSAEHNMLRPQYRNGVDSHPNQAANKVISPIFAEFIVRTVGDFRGQK
jgi:hypothetical protein